MLFCPCVGTVTHCGFAINLEFLETKVIDYNIAVALKLFRISQFWAHNHIG
jgi:hypothetical protein